MFEVRRDPGRWAVDAVAQAETDDDAITASRKPGASSNTAASSADSASSAVAAGVALHWEFHNTPRKAPAMNEDFFISKLETLQVQLAAHQAVLRVLVLSAPESLRQDLLRLAQDVDDAMLHLPVPDVKRDVFAQVLRRLSAP